MVKTMELYIDESGSRMPNCDPTKEHNPKWFGMGGILFNEEDKIIVEQFHKEFYLGQNLSKDVHLHSYEIRRKQGNFVFLKEYCPDKLRAFMEDLSNMLIKVPVFGIGCVIDQKGYHNRYQDQYRKDIWWLCKTAFSICVERAAKYAKLKGRMLRVNVEKSDPNTDKKVEQYYKDIKESGMPFSNQNMRKYNPLDISDFKEILYDFKLKQKQSISMQVADLFLYPICRGGYEGDYKPYRVLEQGQKLINQNVDTLKIEEIGIKYSCFENR